MNVSLFLALFQESTGLVLFTSVMMGILSVLQLIGAIIIIIYGVEESDTLINELHEVFLEMVYAWDIDDRASAVMKQIMEYVR